MAVQLSTGYVQRRNEGHSFASLFNGGCIELRTGAQPANADMPATGTLVGRITRDGAEWSPGSPTAGLRFTATGRYMSKDFADVWRLVGLDTGEPGWMRLIGNVADAGGASLTAPRIDGAVGLLGDTTDVQLFLPTLALSPATIIDINYWWFAPPPLPGD